MNSTFKRIISPTLLCLVFFVNFSCKKTDLTPSVVERGGLALTFDDHYIDNWFLYMNLLDSMGVKATFYISNYNKFTADQKAKLHKLQEHGHEIAFHSTTHANFLKSAASDGCDKLIKDEVIDGLELMHKDGFYPTTFAYPFGKHSDVLDKLLYKYFKSVRALNGTHDLSLSLAPLQNNKMLFGLGIDETSKRSMEKINGLLYLAQKTDRCAVLLVHNIERHDTDMQVPIWKLREVLASAKSFHLKFYTVSQISR